MQLAVAHHTARQPAQAARRETPDPPRRTPAAGVSRVPLGVVRVLARVRGVAAARGRRLP
ncbi:MAG TPA: hypothetical protein VFJ82_05835 [Longimicrobium sp.]|nr:hypothetical protein [Longimicrobium sp.]